MPAFSSTDELTVFSTALAGQYEVEREIGRGGMGVVYLARDLRLDRMVAIKTLPLHLADDATIRERFLREARTAARLSHPNIVPVHRADEVGGQVFFVMGFVDGDSLAARLASAGALPPKVAVPILRDVAAALGYAHRQGIVHRDVKTENILLDSVGGRAMVTDFGIARVAEAAPLTATGQVLGTVYYLSPEQVAGDDVDARSDVYALGVVGYAMLAGKFPFEGPLASAVLVAHVNKQPVPLGVAAPHVPASLATIIDRCLAKNPDHRFQACADMDAALAAAEADAARVSTVPSPSKSPLVSDTEARAIFQRAAELQSMTHPQTRPVIPQRRDAASDASRKEGFRTANLREAAREAGIGDEFVQRALIERGLGAPAATTAAREEPVVVDLTPGATWWGGQPSRLSYESVIQGELDERDFDIMVDTIRSRAGAWGGVGQFSTAGKSFTWASESETGRKLHVSVFPRNGKTTIRVFESISETYAGIYGGVMGGLGGGGGAMLIALMKKLGPFETVAGGRGLDNPNVQLGLILWLGALVPLAYFISRFSANAVSRRRQVTLRTMLRELAEKAREAMDFGKP
ncbi:MAG TPA: serine/threonine-protein kinase [Gemmatimonadaceae bacterium]|nr:serine/threonine-protein kinase [Gemmatimonadaceae bacterium]